MSFLIKLMNIVERSLSFIKQLLLMKVRNRWNKLLIIAIATWIFTFTFLSFRMISLSSDGIDGSSVDSRLMHSHNKLQGVFRAFDQAGKAFMQNIPVNWYAPVEEFQKAEIQRRELNKVVQLVEPVANNQNVLKGDNTAGEMNAPVKIEVDKLSKEEKEAYDKGWADHAFNEFASKKISLDRHFPDFRDPECKAIQYKDVLPKASVIVIFHNEAWTVLLRTVHSVLNQSPSKYLEEIVLVDDASTKDYLGKQLDDYVNSEEKVKLIRLPKRSGLIVARIKGADVATGESLIFLDSHCEVTTGWIEPLLKVIDDNPYASVVPIIETINDLTFTMNNMNIEGIQVGGFTWDLIFNWHTIPDHERKRRKNRTDPIRSPTMAGGLFAIKKDWFEKLGKYDPGMKIWGGENLELSLKLWLCGGELVTSPCSHVGHIFRKRSPYKWPKGENVVLRNTMRVALVWLDEYLPYYLNNVPKDKRDPSLYGDLSDRHAIRERLKCKNFSFFHDNIYPELFVPKNMVKSGEIRNKAASLCVDSHATKNEDAVIAYPCHNMLGPQLWYYSADHEIRKEAYCLDYPGGLEGKNVPDKIKVYSCHGSKGNQLWTLNSNGQIVHSSGFCLSVDNQQKLMMTDCDNERKSQLWEWNNNT